MPQLNKATAKKVDNAEQTEGFPLLPEGLYLATLMEVDGTGQGPKGPYWTWQYQIPEDAEEFANSRFWNTTSLSEGAMGMPGGLKQTFAAFGVEPDTDTDDLCGQSVQLYVVQAVSQGGKSKGKMVNQVEEVFPADYEGDGDDFE